MKIFDNKSRYFPKIFRQKMSDFVLEIFVFLGPFLLPEKNNN